MLEHLNSHMVSPPNPGQVHVMFSDLFPHMLAINITLHPSFPMLL